MALLQETRADACISLHDINRRSLRLIFKPFVRIEQTKIVELLLETTVISR
jgi:hypothetical protein